MRLWWVDLTSSDMSLVVGCGTMVRRTVATEVAGMSPAGYFRAARRKGCSQDYEELGRESEGRESTEAVRLAVAVVVVAESDEEIKGRKGSRIEGVVQRDKTTPKADQGACYPLDAGGCVLPPTRPSRRGSDPGHSQIMS